MTAQKKGQPQPPDPLVKALGEELARMKELAARAQADLQNARERMRREAQEVRAFALEGMFLKLLPTVDNLRRAFDHLPADLAAHEWVRGLRAVEQAMAKDFADSGLRKMECMGQAADPHRHEVLASRPGAKDVILAVVGDGYELHGKMLRPAKVIVGDGTVGTGQ